MENGSVPTIALRNTSETLTRSHRIGYHNLSEMAYLRGYSYPRYEYCHARNTNSHLQI